jgi:tRNA(Ile)-lysidine synthase
MAHHLNDQAETFLWRLMRGAGGKGLGGMSAHDPFPGHPKLTVARPFLQIPKLELSQFAEGKGIQFREDASNEDSQHLRNRIRHRLLPELRRHFHPEIDRAILQSQGLVRADADFASATAQEWIASPKRAAFSQLHPALQRWVIWHQLIELKLEPQHDQIEILRKSPGRPISINPRQALRLNPDGRVQLHETAPLKHNPRQNVITPSALWTEYVLAKTRIRCRIAPTKPRAFEGELFDAGRVGEKILLRHWQPGDRFQPIGMEQPVKLQDLFTNAKVPAAEKRQRVLACTETGDIFWVQGLRIGEIAKTQPHTARFLGWICGKS